MEFFVPADDAASTRSPTEFDDEDLDPAEAAQIDEADIRDAMVFLGEVLQDMRAFIYGAEPLAPWPLCAVEAAANLAVEVR